MPSEAGTGALAPGIYVVATPIGNLGDLTPRALRTLLTASLVLAEDTRTVRRLFAGATPQGRIVGLTEHNVVERIPGALREAADGSVAIASEAGTPGVSDPGMRLVTAAHEAGVPVFAVAGPSALAAALSVSGFESGGSNFLGFLPKATGERAKVLQAAAAGARTLVFFEAPQRLARVLRELAELFADPEVVVCREMTKLHEEIARGPASALALRFFETRGECTVVVRVPEVTISAEDAALAAYMAEMERAGARRSLAAAEAARRFGVSRERAYVLWGARPPNER